MIDILDLLHVTPRLWDAAALFHPRESDAAKRFVRERLLRILHGHVDAVVRGLRWMGTSRGLRGNQRTKLQTICGYLENNRHRMRYDEYLACGYPIASGVIEGACRNLINDRLELTGMSWTPQGAESIMRLRAVHINHDWESFWKHRRQSERRRLYGIEDRRSPEIRDQELMRAA